MPASMTSANQSFGARFFHSSSLQANGHRFSIPCLNSDFTLNIAVN